MVTIGIDIGTQGLKAVVVGEQMDILSEATRSYEVKYPRPGWAEQDPAKWERAMGVVVSSALARAVCKPEDVSAIGIAGQLDGCIAVGADGMPLYPCIIWMDRRATLPDSAPTAEILRPIAGINPDPGHQAAKIRWLMDNISECREAVCYHQPVSYMVSRLTGKNVFDHGLASTTMLYSLEKRDYDPSLIEAFGVDRKKLPDIADASSIAGTLNSEGSKIIGLPEGIPVAVGTGDDFASPLGAGIISPGTVVCVIGTAEVVGAVDASPKIDSTGLLETHGFACGQYFIENPGWFSGGAAAWFTKVFNLKDFMELDDVADKAPAGSEGLIFLPALSGAMSPEWIPSARGCFYGLTPAHGIEHLARAVLEGCAFAMRDVIERLKEMQVPVEKIMLLGGGARSLVWAKIRASVSGLPVHHPITVDTAAIGAAMLAAVAAGTQKDLSECARKIGGKAMITYPIDSDAPAYDKAYKAYRKLFECLKPMF